MTKLTSSVSSSASFSGSVAMVANDEIDRYTREELQRYIAQAAIEIGLPGNAVKHTRVARALLRLAAMAEISAGYDRETFLGYAGKAYDKVARDQGKPTTVSLPGGGKPALKAKSGLGIPKMGSLAAVKKLSK